jgi:hypothetical protein
VCTEPANVRCAESNGLAANASPLLSLTLNGHARLPACNILENAAARMKRRSPRHGAKPGAEAIISFVPKRSKGEAKEPKWRSPTAEDRALIAEAT